MNTIFYNEPYCNGQLFFLSRIDNISTIKDNIVYIDSKEMFNLREWTCYRPKCVFVEHSTLFSHAVSYCISIDVAVVSVKRDEIIEFEGNDIIIDFTNETICNYNNRSLSLHQSHSVGRSENINTIKTRDGRVVKLYATIKNSENAIQAKNLGVRNAGLVCTEFLFSSFDATDFEQSLNMICRQFLNGMTYIRLFDYDVDKLFIDGNSTEDIGRGIRAIYNEKIARIINTQLNHIISLSKKQKVCVVVPYVTTVEDVILVDKIISNNNNGQKLPICAMIETPASFFSVPQISEYVTSFSIGTNDLLSAFFACDRDSISDGFNYCSPYNWGLVKMLSEFPTNCLSKTKVCGQLPLYPLMLEVLVSLGFRSFSIPSPMLKLVAKRISNITTINKSTLMRITKNCYNDELMVRQLLNIFNYK